VHPVKALQNELKARGEKKRGRVVSVASREIVVATANGTASFPRTDATAYRVGDEVVFRNGNLLGKTAREESLPVFVI
jgi:hypothetical protein